MGEGNYKRIDEIELGESVLVFDEENDEFKEGKVNSIMKKLHDDCYELTLESGQTLKPTGNHPFLLRDKGWSTIDRHNPNHAGGNGVVEVGDYVRDLDGWVEITEIKKIEGEHITYNLLNQDYGTIVAHDVVSHNSSFCFTYDTMITLSDGTYQPIIKIRPGDIIKTYDVENNKIQDSKVLEVVKIRHDNIVTYTFDDDSTITATDDHPFYIVGDSEVDSDYRPLKIGDVVLTDELNKLKVVHIEVINKEEITYNINSTNNGVNYFANKVLVSDESDT
jgi:intein/homing endonuclease